MSYKPYGPQNWFGVVIFILGMIISYHGIGAILEGSSELSYKSKFLTMNPWTLVIGVGVMIVGTWLYFMKNRT